MVRVGGMDPDKRQEIVETESFLIDGQNGMGGTLQQIRNGRD